MCEICAEGIFVTFPWWLKNAKSRSKLALVSNERHFEIWFPNKRTITFFWRKLSKLHKKDPILNVATTFFLKQGETRTSHGPIPHPLKTTIKKWNTLGIISTKWKEMIYSITSQPSEKQRFIQLLTHGLSHQYRADIFRLERFSIMMTNPFILKFINFKISC